MKPPVEVFQMHRRMTVDGCEEVREISKEQTFLDQRRSSFILRNKFRKLAGDKRLGVLWVVLEPLVMSLVYLFVLTVLRSNIRSESIFIGITLWGVATVSLLSGVQCLHDFSGGLKCERVRTRVLVKPMIQFRIIDSASRTLGVAIILFYLFDVGVIPIISFMLIGVVLGLTFEGLGLNLSRIGHAIPDIKVLVRYFMRLMFFAGPALYPLTYAHGLHYTINLINPFTYFVELSRYLADLESAFSDLKPMYGILTMCLLVALSFRGYFGIDKLRWELSAWS
jgi:lipopolysaccharide transport system permease protein